MEQISHSKRLAFTLNILDFLNKIENFEWIYPKVKNVVNEVDYKEFTSFLYGISLGMWFTEIDFLPEIGYIIVKYTTDEKFTCGFAEVKECSMTK